MAIVGTFAAMSDPGHAEPVVSSPAEVVSQPPAGVAVSTPNTSPRISDDGNVVVFDSTTPGNPAIPHVMIRDRTAGTTTPVPDAPSSNSGVSGNGCVVAYSVPAAAPNTVQLLTVNRCSTVPAGSLAAPVPVGTAASPSAVNAAPPTPALSFDGRVVAWSTGTTVLRYVDGGSGYVLADTISPPLTIPVPPQQSLVTGPTVDLTSDGTRIVFVAGPGTGPYLPAPANVFVWTAATTGASAQAATTQLVSATPSGQLGAGSSTAPSISGDGGIVTYQSDSTDLAGASSATAPFVMVADRAARTSRLLASGASKPVVSTDGTSIAYDTSTDVHLARSTGTPPFATTAGVSLSTAVNGTSPTGPSVSGPVLSANGGVAAFDSTHGAGLVTDAAYASGTYVFARVITEVTPPTTPPPTAPTTAPTTTAPAPTTTDPPEPSTTVPATTVPLRPVTPTTTSPPFRPSFPGTGSSGGGSSSGGSSRPVGSSTVTIQPSGPIEGATLAPVGVDFSPTIVGVGRQVATLTLSNPTSGSIDRGGRVDPERSRWRVLDRRQHL